MHFNALIEIRADHGKKIRDWFYQRFLSHRTSIGLSFHPVISGSENSSALKITVGLFFWEYDFYLFKWRTPLTSFSPVKSFSEAMGRSRKDSEERE